MVEIESLMVLLKVRLLEAESFYKKVFQYTVLAATEFLQATH